MKKRIVIVTGCLVVIVGAIFAYIPIKNRMEKRAEDKKWEAEKKHYEKLSKDQPQPEEPKIIWSREDDKEKIATLDIPEMDGEVELRFYEGAEKEFHIVKDISAVDEKKTKTVKEDYESISPEDFEEDEFVKIEPSYKENSGGLDEPVVIGIGSGEKNTFYGGGNTFQPCDEVETINEVKTCDYNLDNITDIAMFGTDDKGKKHVWFVEGVVGSANCGLKLIDDAYWFSEDELQSNLVEHNMNDNASLGEVIDGDLTYKSYHDGYFDLICQVEMDSELPNSFRYNLVDLDDNDIPELIVYDINLCRGTAYTFKNGKVVSARDDYEDNSPYGKYSLGEIADKLKIESCDIKKIDENNEEFSINGDKYCLKYRDLDNHKRQFSLTKKEGMDRLEVKADNHQAYLFTNKDGKAFIYIFALTDKPTSKLYIYNLSDGKIRKPILYDGEYSLYNGEIKDSRDFKLQCPENSVVDSAVQKTFFITATGIPFTKETIAQYISSDSIIFGNKIAKKGDKIILEATKELCFDDKMDGEVIFNKTKTFKKGEEFTLYKYEPHLDDEEVCNTVWVKTKKGKVIGFKVYGDDFVAGK